MQTVQCSTHTHRDLQRLKLTDCLCVFMSREALIGTAFHTDGCCYCVAGCGIAMRHQSDSKSFLKVVLYISLLLPMSVFFV